jgi:hypothetical protein
MKRRHGHWQRVQRPQTPVIGFLDRAASVNARAR